ncbi:hypothetical protein ACTFIZ_005930 [Dictyostelium cf. discoideum]
MKLLYLLVSLIFLIVLAKGDVCMRCFQDEEKCTFKKSGDDFLYTGSCLSDGFVCGPYNNQTKENFVCRPVAQLGEECFRDSDTESGICKVGLVCLKGICSDAKFSSIGEECEKQSDCYSKFSTCTNNVCTNPTNECKYEEDCLYTQYCQDKVCTPRIQRGKNCSLEANQEPCAHPLFCQNTYSNDEEVGTCQNLFQNGLGSACISDEDCNTQEALYCSEKSNICEKYVTPTQNGNCTNDKDVCGQFQECGCGGKCYDQFTPITQRDVILPLYECLNENECSLSGNLYSPSSCASKNCRSKVCKYLETSYGLTDDTCPSIKSSVESYCNDSSKISYSLFSLLLILIISLLF